LKQRDAGKKKAVRYCMDSRNIVWMFTRALLTGRSLRRYSTLSTKMAIGLRSCLPPIVLVSMMIATLPVPLAAQWEWMRDLTAATWFGDSPMARNAHRLVGVQWSREIYESELKPIRWRPLATLPAEVDMLDVLSIELTPSNEVTVVTKHAVYLLDERAMKWECITSLLVKPEGSVYRDVAVSPNGMFVIATNQRVLHRSWDRGQSWERITLRGSRYLQTLDVNPVQYSSSGMLYVNTNFGLDRSWDDGDNFESVTNIQEIEFSGRNIDSKPVHVINDSTIWCVGRDGDIYKLNTQRMRWDLIRAAIPITERYQNIAVGDDGTFFVKLSKSSNMMISWTNDGGITWGERVIGSDEPAREIIHGNILFGDSASVLLYGNSTVGVEAAEVMLHEGASYRRSDGVAHSWAGWITGNATHLLLVGYWNDYYYDKVTGHTLCFNSSSYFSGSYNIILRDNFWRFEQINRGRLDDEGKLLSNHVEFRTDIPQYHREALGLFFLSFVMTSKGDIIGVRLDAPFARFYRASAYYNFKQISDFRGELIAINSKDEYVVANQRGEYECYNADDTLFASGALQAFPDSIICVQMSSKRDLTLLSKGNAYYLRSKDSTWARSQIPGSAASFRKIVVDRFDDYYIIDNNNGVFWSRDGGKSYIAFGAVIFDSLNCTVTDIYSDREYVYLSTTGCGVHRCALPGLNGIETVRPVVVNHDPLNIYCCRSQTVIIDPPFRLDGATILRLTDLGGRVRHEVQYTVDIPRSRITLETSALPSGVYPFIISSLTEAVTGKLMIQR
jgi:hypothetical protein